MTATLSTISQKFTGILLDAYGVFWGGNKVGLLPSCKETMEKLVASGKIVGILSNSSQSAHKEIEKVQKAGLLQGVHFHFFITSGQIAKDIFQNERLPFPTSRKKYWQFGDAHPRFSSVDLSPYVQTMHLEEADFIYISIPHIDGIDQTDPSVFHKSVEKIAPYKLPMVCANPDHFAHEGNPPQQVVRQGSIAKMYEELGGDVFFIGKPSKNAFSYAMKEFETYGITLASDILMVGDTPETDIRGANAFGMASCLLTKTGIMAEKIANQGLERALSMLTPEERPHYLLERL